MPHKSKGPHDVHPELHPDRRTPGGSRPATIVPIGSAAAPEGRLQPRIGRPESYPWKRWVDGRIHTVRHGKHFKSKPKSFARILQRRAASDGMKVVVIVDGKQVRFQFTKVE